MQAGTSAPSGRADGNRGQSEVIAVALLAVVAVVGTIAVVTYGSVALADVRQSSQVERTERGMAVFDGRASAVALGTGDGATVDVGWSDRGQFHVDEDAGWLRVRHLDYAGGRDETVYNGTLGAVVYRNGDRELVYQGGGIWRHDAGGTRLVSPPEFHYRGATLSLPVVQIRGDGSAGGHARARVRSLDGTRIFPNSTTTGGAGVGSPYDGTGVPYRNIVTDGRVAVTVHGDYYRAWARYFRSRTEGVVTVDHAARTATLELTTLGTFGDFEMPPEGEAIELRGVGDDHGFENFTVALAPDDLDNARFNNLQWSFYATDGDQRFEIHLRKSGEYRDPSADCDRETVAATVYYSDTGGATYHGWQSDDAFVTDCVDRDGDGTADETRLVADLTGDASLRMGRLTRSDTVHVNPSGATHLDPVTFDGHGVDWEPTTFSTGAEVPIGHLLDHYVALFGPEVDLTVDDKSSDTVDEDRSYGTIRYEGEGTVIYLHVSENPVEVDLG